MITSVPVRKASIAEKILAPFRRESAFLARKAPDATREGHNLLLSAATEVAPGIQEILTVGKYCVEGIIHAITVWNASSSAPSNWPELTKHPSWYA